MREVITVLVMQGESYLNLAGARATVFPFKKGLETTELNPFSRDSQLSLQFLGFSSDSGPFTFCINSLTDVFLIFSHCVVVRTESPKTQKAASLPPSMTISEPVIKRLSSEARKRAALAISSGSPKWPSGILGNIC